MLSHRTVRGAMTPLRAWGRCSMAAATLDGAASGDIAWLNMYRLRLAVASEQIWHPRQTRRCEGKLHGRLFVSADLLDNTAPEVLLDKVQHGGGASQKLYPGGSYGLERPKTRACSIRLRRS